MKPEFPNRFEPTSFGGVRARAFSRREDAFQQLVGDGLQFAVGPKAHVAATKGRDGSIDAWVETTLDTPTPFLGLPGPFIIECKDHDDKLTNWVNNIFSGWGKVKEKLGRASKKGWSDLFAPWKRARGYAYCVSAVLNQSVRADLTAEVQRFFREIPSRQSAPLIEARVLDWADLRPWLSAMSRVSDAWLGIGSTAILCHQEYLASLRGFREYLLDSRLPFVRPETKSSISPETLFQALSNSEDKPGTLLVGAGGVGKTRTSLEVSRIAEQQRWRSLHVLPDMPGVTDEDLTHIVLLGDSPTLLIFDYIDRMQRLDLSAMRRLVARAEQRGVRLRLLANCGPSWVRRPEPSRDELFTVVEFSPERVQSAEIINTILTNVAPRCVARFGEQELHRICGQRPIIALLIARELERRFVANILDKLELSESRTSDLLRWLRKRLADDGLRVDVPSSPLEPSRPSGLMVGAAAAFICAPNPSNVLAKAAEAASGARGDPCDGSYLIAALESLGWLVKKGDWLASAHDVVADYVFDQVVRESGIVRKLEFDAVLSCWPVSTNIVGRLATALRRLILASGDKVSATRLQDAAGRWLEEHSALIGEHLASTDASHDDSASYTLGAILYEVPWRVVATQKWNDLVSPWLNSHVKPDGFEHSHNERKGTPSTLLGAFAFFEEKNGQRRLVILDPESDRWKDSDRCNLIARVWRILHHLEDQLQLGGIAHHYQDANTGRSFYSAYERWSRRLYLLEGKQADLASLMALRPKSEGLLNVHVVVS